MQKVKVLIIRFSSIGDVTQALSIPSFIHSHAPGAEIHFVTRSEFAGLLLQHPFVKQVWMLQKSDGLKGLFRLIAKLRAEKFSHIYDAHNNLRSFIIRMSLWGPKKLVRPMMRMKRFFLLRFHLNFFEQPFSGQRDLVKPLEKWNLKYFLPPAPQLFLNHAIISETELILKNLDVGPFIALAPSATYELKRWPISYWKKLIELNPLRKFVVLAGPTDHFTSELDSLPNVINLTGKTNLLQSAVVVKNAMAVVSNDTGLLHIAEQLGKPAIALMGPAPFGFPSRTTTILLERKLPCRPCSKHGQGPCINSTFQECLRTISPEEVSLKLATLVC